MSKARIIILVLFVLAVAGILLLGPEKYLNLEYLKSQQEILLRYKENHLPGLALAYLAIYIFATAISIPGALVLTLAGGAIFGFWLGSGLVSIASTIGATLAFLLSRYLFRGAVENKMGSRLRTVQENFDRDGAFYLFSLRLVPVFPFFAINLLMGLTPIRTGAYIVASWLGMLPATLVYVNAGTQLGRLESLRGILSPGILSALLLLAVFPYVAKYLLKLLKRKKSRHVQDQT
ncbi:MAG: TVP38/TMEM64 family protein [Pseudomonadota bacterium]|nr:TVP38/TMEM64 family protein [Pseudomonadota bacterium]